MSDLLQDIRLALRQLQRSPGFAAVTVLTLALGIGANTAIFSVVNAVLLRPLPYADPSRLVQVSQSMLEAHLSVAFPTVQDLRKMSGTFSSVAAYSNQRFNFTGQGDPKEIQATYATPDLFSTLGVTPELGRTFTDQESRASVVVLSHGLWATVFGRDQGVLGRSVTLDGNPYTVIGVMPAEFHFPNEDVQLWAPIGGAFVQNPSAETDRGIHLFNAVARLAPGATSERVMQDLAVLAHRIDAETAGGGREVRVVVSGGDPPPSGGPVGAGPRIRMGPEATQFAAVPLGEQVIGDARPTLYVLFATVALVLLIACANAANLLVARANTRRKEFVIRQSLGAGRTRLIRQVLTESMILALAAGLIGIALSYWGLDLLLASWPASLARARDVGIDRWVLGFTLGVSVLTGVGFGILPAVRASSPALEEALREEAGTMGGHRKRQRAQRALVVSQLAVALVLIVGAGLLVRSFVRLLEIDPGYDTRDVLAARIRPTPSRYANATARTDLLRSIRDDLSARPGVTSAALTRTLPLSGSLMMVTIPARQIRPEDPDEVLPVAMRIVGADYFKTMRISLVAGRAIDAGDRAGAPSVVVVNTRLGKRLWPDQSPLGKQIPFDRPDGGPRDLTVVGVVGDIHYTGLSDQVMPEIYLPLDQMGDIGDQGWIVARVDGNPLRLAGAVRESVRRLDPSQPVADVLSLDQMVSRSTAARRFNMLLITLFAAMALGLALIGIYGVTSYSLSQRTHELGIRLALGATGRDVIRLVLGEGLVLALIGAVLGIGLALAGSRFLASMLFGVSARDALTFTGAALLLVVAALLAAWVPARRAARVDPLISLRSE